MPLTICQRFLNEVMHSSAQTIADNGQCRKSWQETKEHGGGRFMGEKEEESGDEHRGCVAAADNQIHSWLPWASAQPVSGPQPQRRGWLSC